MLVLRRYSAPAVALFLLLGVAAYYAWTPTSFKTRWLTLQPTDYYHELTDALLAGQLHLKRPPDPRLISLPDPYDPAANAPYRVNDLSYHEGRYYLYHSAVPALTLFAPVKLLTGQYLSPVAAVWVFSVIGAAASLALLLGLRGPLAPRCPRLVLVSAALALTFAQGAHVVLRSGMLNQVPIAAAYGFLMLGLLGLWRARPDARHPTAWLALGSLALGLAIAARPNYLFGAALALLAVIFARWRFDEGRWSGRLSRDLLAAGLPAGCLVAGLLAYNYARFGDPREFGMRYMLGGWDQRALPELAWGNFRENAYHYLLSPGTYDRHFPFVTASSWQAIGVFLHTPFVWLAGLSPLALWQTKDGATRSFCLALLGVGLANFTLLLLLPSGNNAAVLTSANARYLLDFLPAWVLLAILGAMMTGHQLADRPVWRHAFTGLVALLAAVSALAGLSLDLGRYPLESIRPLARWLSQPAWWADGLTGTPSGPLVLDLTFPTGRTGGREPLLAVGSAEAGDLVYVVYESTDTLRFGLVSIGRNGPLSEPVSLDYARSHRLELHLGPLNPPVSHPQFAKSSDEAVALLSRRLVLRLDGRDVMAVPACFSAPGGAPVHVGRAPFLRDYAAESFNGAILRQERLPLSGLDFAPAPAYGALRLRLRFPTDPTTGAEPLIVTGMPQAGDVLYAIYRPDGDVQLGLDHWGHRGLLSEPLRIDRTQIHELEVSLGSLYPSAGHAAFTTLPIDVRRRLKERIMIRLNGHPVLDAEQPTYEASAYDVNVGRNTIGASTCGYLFSGEILAAERMSLPAGPP